MGAVEDAAGAWFAVWVARAARTSSFVLYPLRPQPPLRDPLELGSSAVAGKEVASLTVKLVADAVALLVRCS